MNSQALRLYVKNLEIFQEEWEKVRRKLIEKIPLYDRRPDLYVEVKYGKRSKKTRVVKDSLSPQWDEPIEIIVSNNNEQIAVEVLHSSFLNVRNPRIGRITFLVNDLLIESQKHEVVKELYSTQGTEIVGKLCIRLLGIKTEKVLEEVKVGVSNLHCFEKSDICNAIEDFLELIEPYMSAIDEVSGINLYLSSGWMILSSIPKIALKQYTTNSKMIDLVKDMSETFRCAKAIEGIDNKNGSLEEAFLRLSCEINECCLFIREYLGHGYFDRMISLKNQNKVDEFRKTFEAIKNHFHLTATVQNTTSNMKIGSFLSRVQKSIDLHSVEDRLKPEMPEGTPHSICLPGTRTETLEQIINLLMDTKCNIVWLNGPAGCGKSTIALTIAEHFEKLSRLGGYMYFTRGKSQPELLIRTVAYKLASIDSFVAEHILNACQNCVTLTPKTQFEQLLLKPLEKAEEAFDGPIVIILDALDECGDRNSRAGLMELFYNGSFTKLPKNVRILVTSRPEDDIRAAMEFQKGLITNINLDPTDGRGKRDVSIYLREKLTQELKRKRGQIIPANWPSESDMEKVIRAANGLFIWASTFVKLVSTDALPIELFAKLVQQIQFSPSLFDLDEMYLTILSSCVAYRGYKAVLSQILAVLLLSPTMISLDGVEKLIGLDQGKANQLLSGLQSVIFYAEGEPVRFFHTSFSDFLTDKGRSEDYYVNTSMYTALISERCFSVIFGSGGLRVNICNLQSSLIRHESVSNLRGYISEQLELACTLWPCMFNGESTEAAPVHMFQKLVDRYILQWFEALSLTNNFHFAPTILLLAIKWAANCLKECISKLKEARRIADKYYIPITQSAPHVYLSVIPFEKASPIVEQYHHLVSPVVKIEEFGARPDNPVLKVWKAHDISIQRVVFTPDGNQIISCDFNTVKVWDAHSAVISRAPMTVEHPFFIKEFAISSTGDRFAAVLGTSTPSHKTRIVDSIGIWDTRTWETPIGPFSAGVEVISLRFIYQDDEEILGTCSRYGVVSLWDTKDGKSKGSPGGIGEHRRREVPNHIPYCTEDAMHKEANEEVNSNARNEREKRDNDGVESEESNESIVDAIQSASFSRIAGRVAYLYYHQTLFIWNWVDNEVLPCFRENEMDYHLGNVYFVPSGRFVICSRLAKMQLVNATTGVTIKTFDTYTPTYAISHDEKLLVTARRDITFWDIESGKIILGIGLHHLSEVTSIEFSADASRILVSRWNGRVELYDAEYKSRKSQTERIENVEVVPGMNAFTKDDGFVSLWSDHYLRMLDKKYKLTSELNLYDPKHYSSHLTHDGKRLISQTSDDFNTYHNGQKLYFYGGNPIEVLHTDTATRSQHILVAPQALPQKEEEEKMSSWPGDSLSHSYNHDGRIIGIYFKNSIYIFEQMEGEVSDYISTRNVSIASLKNKEDFISRRQIVGVSPNGSLIALFRFGAQPTTTCSITLVDTTDEGNNCVLATPASRHLSSKKSTPADFAFSQFSPCDPCIAATNGNIITVYSTKDGQALYKLQGLEGGSISITYSQDGSRLASGSNDGTVIVWNLETKQIIFGPFQAHHGDLYPSLSYDNQRLATRSWDGSVRFYDLNQTQIPISKNIGYDNDSALHTWAREFSSKVDRFSSWAIENDGWIRDDQGQLLVWVPPDVRPVLWNCKDTKVIKFSYHVKLTFRCDAE